MNSRSTGVEGSDKDNNSLYESPFIGNKDRNYFILTLSFFGGGLFLFLFIYYAVFLFSVQKKETVVVPDLGGMTLSEAIITLQEYHLTPRLQLRFSEIPSELGKVIDQIPAPHSRVSVDREILMTVSRGIVIDKIPDYAGRMLSEVRAEIESQNLVSSTAIRIANPVSFVTDSAPVGEILAQSPPAGEEIGEGTPLELIVSKGNTEIYYKAVNYLNVNYLEAVKDLAENNRPFIVQAISGNGNGSITGQTPEAGSRIPIDGLYTLTMAIPRQDDENMVFGIYNYELPSYAAPVLVEVAAIVPNRDPEILLSSRLKGGSISIPYLLPTGSAITLTVNGRQMDRVSQLNVTE